jgi:hypothetical protein
MVRRRVRFKKKTKNIYERSHRKSKHRIDSQIPPPRPCAPLSSTPPSNRSTQRRKFALGKRDWLLRMRLFLLHNIDYAWRAESLRMELLQTLSSGRVYDRPLYLHIIVRGGLVVRERGCVGVGVGRVWHCSVDARVYRRVWGGGVGRLRVESGRGA